MRVITSEVEFMSKGASHARRGFEYQRYVCLPDGSTTLSVTSIALDKSIFREVVINLNDKMRPLDSYVRIHHGTRLEGNGWFQFGKKAVTADIWNEKIGLWQDRAEADTGVRGFCAHPISCDLLLAASFDRASNDRVQLLDGIFMSSPHHFGATGPEIASVLLEMEYVGQERLTTKVGELETDHWRILPGNSRTGHTHPGEDLWALKDTFLFVHAEIESIGFEYRLTRFQDDEF